MLDCRGQKLRAGDEVAVSNYRGRLFIGHLLEDPEDKQWVRLGLSNDKPRRFKKNPRRTLNLTAYK